MLDLQIFYRRIPVIISGADFCFERDFLAIRPALLPLARSANKRPISTVRNQIEMAGVAIGTFFIHSPYLEKAQSWLSDMF